MGVCVCGNNTICAPGGSQRAARKPCRLLAPSVRPDFLLSLEKKGGAMPGCLSRHEAWAQQTRLNLSHSGQVTSVPSVLEGSISARRFHPCWKTVAISHPRKGEGLPRCRIQPLEEGSSCLLKPSRPVPTCSKSLNHKI